MFTLEGFWPMLKGSFWLVAKNLRSLTGVFTFEDVHFEEFYFSSVPRPPKKLAGTAIHLSRSHSTTPTFFNINVYSFTVQYYDLMRVSKLIVFNTVHVRLEENL
ncbi:hypothetical protein BpHYR1_005193 [Brachionus plicatilis]|uniref:Uncharacterized protein n=1 Tax=Brachionus plicatilis TaxID=10195 RepID=A0A3M7RA41_BRAPC|nr:hypothetical protein BpHYR1_005193 [Brachionus plicatilis]